MNIGLTYDLRHEYLAKGYGEEETAEFDRPDTIEALEGALRQLGHQTERIGNAVQLTEKLVRGNRWDLVFNIAEGLDGIGREAQIPCILDLYQILYTFSDPLVMSLTLHKGMTKHIIRSAGLPTTDFYVFDHWDELHDLSFDPPYFVKPVAEGTSKGATPDSIVLHRRDLSNICQQLIEKYHQPVIIEPFLPGREFTVGIIGTGNAAKVLGTLEIHLLNGAEPQVYSYINKEQCEELVDYRLADSSSDLMVKKSENIALAAWQAIGCRDAGRVDVRCDADGQPQFIEINPLAGLHPQHSDLPILCNRLGIPYINLIQWILDSAKKRLIISRYHQRRRVA